MEIRQSETLLVWDIVEILTLAARFVRVASAIEKTSRMVWNTLLSRSSQC
jgi:hypothetical protein